MSPHQNSAPDQVRHKARGRLRIAAALTATLFLGELFGGILSNSLALLSDAGHMLGDLFALILSLLSIHWATKPANSRKTYGYYRIEVLATLINGALLCFVAFHVLWEAGERLLTPEPVRLGLMLTIAVAGLLVNIAGLLLLHGVSRQHLLTRSAYLHILSDLLASVGVVLAAIVMYFTGWPLVDPLMSVLIAGFIIRSAYRLLKEPFNILMESAPAGVHVNDVREAVLTVEGVEEIHDLHVWTIGPDFLSASAHLLIPNMTTRESDQIIHNVGEVLRNEFSITHTTFQVATASKCESAHCCP